MANYYEREGREIGSDPLLWCVTGRLTVNFLKPTRIDQPVELRAVIDECSDRKTVLKTTLSSAGEVTAEGEVVAIRVPASWRD